MERKELTLQVLVSTMHQTECSLPEAMNLQTDAIVVNQCDRNEIVTLAHNGNRIQWLSLQERGVGLSRNTALARGTADILLFADDDVVYETGYEKTVLDFFKKHPDVGMAVFNLESLNPDRPERSILKDHRLRWYNCLRYGACRIAVRRECLIHNNIWFSLLFGGGARHQCGEDNLFITDCLKKGIRCMACKDRIGTVKQEESTWFAGYNDKYFTDRGALFAALYGRLAYPVLFLFELRSKNKAQKFCRRLKLGRAGIRQYWKTSRCKS